jgi:uncharacterized protein YicC (UPF0701 family)
MTSQDPQSSQVEGEQQSVSQGFAQQAARLLESARANERAVRDLEEAVQLLDAETRVDPASLLARIDGLAQRLEALTAQLEQQASAYESAVESRLARLEELAERLDAPSVANQLAAILATNQRILEHVDSSKR